MVFSLKEMSFENNLPGEISIFWIHFPGGKENFFRKLAKTNLTKTVKRCILELVKTNCLVFRCCLCQTASCF